MTPDRGTPAVEDTFATDPFVWTTVSEWGDEAPASGMLFLDGAGRVLDADVRGWKVLGWDADGVRGRYLADLLEEGDGTGVGEALERARTSGEFVGLGLPFAGVVGAGMAIAVHPAPGGFTVPVRANSGAGAASVTRSVWERVVASLASGVAVVDATDPEFGVLFANDAFRAATGFDAPALSRRGILALAKLPQELEGALTRAVSGESASLEMRACRRDGSWFWASVTISPVLDDGGAARLVLVGVEDVGQRVASRRALQESERRFRVLAERSGDIMARHAADGRVLYLSPAVQDILGYAPETLVQADPYAFVHPEDVEDLKAQQKAAGPDGSERTHLIRARHADGHYVWLELTLSLVRDASAEVVEVVTVARDVSERVRSEEELRRSQQSFRRLFADNPMPMWVHDSATMEILEVNPATLRLLGYERAEVVGASTADFVAEDERDAYRASAGARACGDALGDVTVRTRAGEALVLALDKSPITFSGRDAQLVVARNVTEARQARRALEASELRFRRLVERSNDVIAITDNRGSATYFSGATERVAGYEPHELLGSGYLECFHPDDLAAAARFRAEIEANGSATLPSYRFRRRDGTWRWFEANGTDLRDEPAVGGVVINTRDVTERVAHVRETEATREGTFRALGVALEYRDLETKGHTDRVVALARRFAEVLGFDEELLTAITWGAYLHDIGKIAMPDSILLKPGRLTESELATVRKHTLIGEEMCADIPFLPESTLQLVRSHHEWWDGTGYPDGLAGHGIPIEARMFALVDVYDALTSERPYKGAWSREAAVTELTRQAGRQFDPGLTAVFLNRVLGGEARKVGPGAPVVGVRTSR